MHSSKGEILASYVLFRELYDKNYRDIYDIIAEFVKDTIITEGKYSFSLKEITTLVNTIFGFDIPDYVIAPSINRIDGINRNNSIYVVSNLKDSRNIIFEKGQDEAIGKNKMIINHLYRFIEEVKKRSLNNAEKDKILKAFYSFLLEEGNGHEYSELISAFVLKNKDNDLFQNQLDLIRQGVVLYTGINYNCHINEVGSWKNEMTIFLEMEILFHIAGYNGLVFKELADELLELIQKVKNKKNKSLIKMRFFNETKNQIERFFDKAKYIVEGQSSLAYDNIAMKEIVNGCKSAADVVNKMSDFYVLLNNKGIIVDEEENYYNKNLTQYNLEDLATLEELKIDETNPDEEHKRLKFISNINKLRRGQVKGDYADCGYLLLTNNMRTLKMSKYLSVENSTVPYAVNMATLTNLFWTRLNKGFGAKDFPKNIDVILKAQIILSKFINDSIGEKYLQIKTELKDGVVTEETVISRIAYLRGMAKKPEDIQAYDIDETLLSITEEQIDKYEQEYESYKEIAKKIRNENKELEHEVKEMKNKYEDVKKELEIRENIDHKEEELKELKHYNASLIEIEEQLRKKFKRKYIGMKVSSCIILILYYVTIIIITCKVGWDKSEMYTYFISFLPIICTGVYYINTSKTLNIKDYLVRKKEKYKMKIYKNHYHIEELINVNKMKIMSIDNDILELKNLLRNEIS